MGDEPVVWVDEEDRVLGAVEYDRAHREGLLHRVAAVYLVNEAGEILVQERADGRLDHSVAGHVQVGESYEENVLRELAEELGVVASEDELQPIGSHTTRSKRADGSVSRHVIMLFVIARNQEVDEFRIDPTEVSRVFWANPHDMDAAMTAAFDPKTYTGGFRSSLKELLARRPF